MTENELLHSAHEEIDLQGSETKPLYISKISLTGEEGSSPLSDSLCKAILGDALSQPLQNVENSIHVFEHVKRKLLFTGLFKDVTVTLDNDIDGAPLGMLRKGIPQSLGLEMPLLTHVRIWLHPAVNLDSLMATTTLSDDVISLVGRKTWRNLLGQADAETLNLGFHWNPVSSHWDAKSIKGAFSLPLVKVPSVRAVLEVQSSQRDLRSRPFITQEDEHTEQEFSVDAGFEKRWLCDKSRSMPLLYTGISVARRNLQRLGPKASQLYSTFAGPFDKTSILSYFTHDTRKCVGSFPLSGFQLTCKNDYVISQWQGASKQLPQSKNFDKAEFQFQHHASYWANRITRSLELEGGGIYFLGSETETVHPQDRFYLGGLNSLKGFHYNGVGLGGRNFYYKLGLSVSHKLINTPLESPLRLQYFLNAGNSAGDFKTIFDSYAAATGVSLLYKTPEAVMDLTYAHPLTARPGDLSKPGLSLGVSLSFF
ncbi:uncharacterized protein ZBIST_2150 [Zygosaccharomyces bailii]|nr:uncharacterized protein ZBIST_2150 [Zygosaccharomyces bailii]